MRIFILFTDYKTIDLGISTFPGLFSIYEKGDLQCLHSFLVMDPGYNSENRALIERNAKKPGIPQCACHFTETCTTCHEDGTTSSKRLETKKLIAKLKEVNPYIESNIFKSVENVNLDTVVAYKKNGVRHHFLEDYYGE